MPFRRNSRKSRPLRRRRNVRRRRRPMTVGRVMRIVDAELKVRDLGVGPVAIPSVAGSLTHISGISLGDTSTSRTGNWLKPVVWMGTITITGNATDATNETVPYRIGCFVWKENQGVNAADIGKLVADTSAPHQQYNIANKGQFKLLWSRTGIVSTNSANPRFQSVHKFYVKPSMKILYEGAAFKNNHLFIFGFSSVAAESNPPFMTFDTRLRYTDS